MLHTSETSNQHINRVLASALKLTEDFFTNWDDEGYCIDAPSIIPTGRILVKREMFAIEHTSRVL